MFENFFFLRGQKKKLEVGGQKREKSLHGSEKEYTKIFEDEKEVF